MTATKVCTQCHRTLPISDFPSNGKWLRGNCRQCQNFYQRERDRRAAERGGITEGYHYLSVEPFRLWLSQRLEESGEGYIAFCERIGIAERNVRQIVSGDTSRARLDVIDRALTNDGWHLAQLYPELYPDAPQAVIGLLQSAAEVAAVEEWENERRAA